MAYKFKPSKSAGKRFRVTKTGKLKRGHGYRSHLMSSRSANKRRKLRRPEVLFEGHARNMRKLMGISHLAPARVEHERDLAEKAKEAGDAGATTSTKAASTPASKKPSTKPSTRSKSTKPAVERPAKGRGAK